MRKSDLFQISDLMDQKFDEKLKNLATKDDLKQFATKDDLKQFATKDDLKQFATKKDLDASEERIILTVYKNFKEFEEKADIKFDKISKELSKRLTKDEIILITKKNFDTNSNIIYDIALDTFLEKMPTENEKYVWCKEFCVRPLSFKLNFWDKLYLFFTN